MSLVLGPLLLATSVLDAGHYYESQTTTTVAGKKKGTRMAVKGWVDGDKSKVEFVSGQRKGPLAVGNYLVTTDGGKTVHLVDPKRKTYGEFDLEQMMATMGQAMNAVKQLGGMVKMEFSDVSSEKLLEEPGESILGHATMHYRFKTSYTMTMGIMGMVRKNKTDAVQDVWSTGDLEARGFGIWLRPGHRLQTGNEELDKMANQRLADIKGFPLKVFSDTTMTNEKGKSRKGTSTMEVTVLREESIPANTFTWPSDYKEIQIIPEMPQK